MNVPTITMPRRQARRLLREHHEAGIRTLDADRRNALRLLKECAKGNVVLDVRDAIRQAPLDAVGRPRIALARSNRLQVHLSSFRDSVWFDRWTERSEITVTLPAFENRREGYALVPKVPPSVAGSLDLSQHWTLWEVEQWSDRPLVARMSRDPLLLKRLSGPMFAVIDTWELTTTERAVLEAAARNRT